VKQQAPEEHQQQIADCRLQGRTERWLPLKHKRELLGAGVFLGALLIGAAFYFDAAFTGWMAQQRTPFGTAFMRNVSRWGDWPSHVALGVPGAAIAYARGNRRWVAIFAAMVLACAVAGSINRVIKVAAGRARPSVKVDTGWNGLRFSSKYNAFPSGHTACTTAFFAALFFARRRIGLAFLPVPLLIAASRLYVGAHHLSDVVAAAVLGAATAWFVWRFVQAKTAGWQATSRGASETA
jgi:undecaprenyl-diphosphatase